MRGAENHLDISGESCFARLAGFLRPIDSDFLPLDRTVARRWNLRWLLAVSRLVRMQSKFLFLLGIQSVKVIVGDPLPRLGKGANRTAPEGYAEARS